MRTGRFSIGGYACRETLVRVAMGSRNNHAISVVMGVSPIAKRNHIYQTAQLCRIPEAQRSDCVRTSFAERGIGPPSRLSAPNAGRFGKRSRKAILIVRRSNSAPPSKSSIGPGLGTLFTEMPPLAPNRVSPAPFALQSRPFPNRSDHPPRENAVGRAPPLPSVALFSRRTPSLP